MQELRSRWRGERCGCISSGRSASGTGVAVPGRLAKEGGSTAPTRTGPGAQVIDRPSSQGQQDWQASRSISEPGAGAANGSSVERGSLGRIAEPVARRRNAHGAWHVRWHQAWKRESRPHRLLQRDRTLRGLRHQLDRGVAAVAVPDASLAPGATAVFGDTTAPLARTGGGRGAAGGTRMEAWLSRRRLWEGATKRANSPLVRLPRRMWSRHHLLLRDETLRQQTKELDADRLVRWVQKSVCPGRIFGGSDFQQPPS